MAIILTAIPGGRPSDLTAGDTTATVPLGAMFHENPSTDSSQDADASSGGGGRLWRYVKNGEASSAFGAGDLVIAKSATSKAVGIISTGAVNPARCIGTAQYAIAAGSFGWVLVEGVGEGDIQGSGAANTPLIASATAGNFDGGGAATASALGYEIDNGASGLNTCYFCFPH